MAAHALLQYLAAVRESPPRLRSPETGLYSHDSINSEAARKVGYDEFAISLMYTLLDLDIRDHEPTTELLLNTYITTYTR